MGLSLKKLGDQLNPFDGGRSYQTQVTNADRAKLANEQLNQARTQSLQKAASMGNVQSQNKLKTNNYQIKYQAPPSFRQNIENATGTVGLGLGRSAIGTAQGLSGMYDLMTPGKGTNRFSQSLDTRAKRFDQIQKDQNRSSMGYKSAQFLGDAGTFLAGGGLANAAVKGASKAPTVVKLANNKAVQTAFKPIAKTNSLANKGINAVAQKGAAGRITAVAAKNAKMPGNLIESAVDTGIGVGQMASKGQKVRPQDVALQAAISTGFNVGLPGTAQGVKEVFRMPSRANIPFSVVRPEHMNAQDIADLRTWRGAMGTGQTMNNPDMVYNGKRASAIAGVDYTDRGAIDDVLRARRQAEDAKMARQEKFNNAKQAVVDVYQKAKDIDKRLGQGGFVRNPLVNPDGTPRIGKGAPIEKTPTAALKQEARTTEPIFERDINTGKMKMQSSKQASKEKYSIANSDISRTKNPGMNQDGFTVEDWGGKKRFVSLDDASPETKMKVRKAEAEFERAKANSTGVVAPGTKGPVQIAREKLNDAYSDAIDDLKLQDYATTENGGRTFNSKYNDWLETKYKDRNIDSATIKDMATNPQKYRSQFEAETATQSQPPTPKVEAPKGAPIEKTATTENPNVVKSNEPEMSFVERQAQAQSDKEAQILKPRGVEAVRSKGRNASSKLYNPYSEAERLNQRNAQAQGLSRTGATKKLDATSDLASKMDFVANSRVAAKQLMEDTGLDKVIQKYGNEKVNVNGKKLKTNPFVLYLAAKRDVAVSGAKGKRIYGGVELDDVNKFIKDFELENPQARGDLEVVKGSFRKLLDDELAAGTITPEFHKNAIATEDYYAPIERVLGSDEVLRPSVNVNNKASLSRTSATRKLEGSSDPVKGDWDAIIGGMQRRVRETKLNQAYGVMYDIAKNKRVDDAVRMGMSKEQSKALIDLQDTITALQKEAQAAKGAVKTAGKKAKVASKKMTAYQNKVNDKAIERIAKNLEVNDVDGAATVRSLKRSDKNQLMSWLQGNMTDAEITNGIKKSAQLQDAVARLQEARAIADDLQTTGTLFKGARSELIQATDARGRQVIRGFVDGYPTWLEVTPEIAKMVQGLEPQKLPGLIKGFASLQRVWRTFWTGAYNPVFNVKSFLLYDPPMAAINQSGSRFQLDPRVAGKAIADAFTDYDGFFKELKRTGVQPVYGSKMSGDIKLDAKVIASHKNFQSRLVYLATHPGQLIEALDVVGGKLAHSTRMRTARAEYAKGISQGLSKNVALENAARAYNNVLPNYARTTRLMKEIDAIIPYASAGVAGNRALTTAMKTDPVGWAAKAGLFATAIAATGEYALGSDETKEFYQDMYDSNKVSVLQNNIVFALPGAKKDPETGEWSGIVKIAIPPEFRAPNALLQQALADNNQVDTGNYDPTLAAATSVATAGITNIGRSGDINAEYNPAIQAGLELATNKQGVTGDSFAYGDNQYLPRNEQINDNTSQLAISGAQAWNKLPIGDISPAALDAQLKGLGMGGNIIRSVGSGLTKTENTTDEQLPGTGLDKSIKGLYSADGTKGMTETGWHFKHQDQVMNELPTKVLRDQFSIVNSKNDSPGDAQAKSQLLYESLQSDGALWDAQKKQNDLDAKKTGISNPLFGLTPAQARAVTLYRGNARMTAAKQTYAKDGSSLFESLGLDEKWYQDFKKQEDAFYKKLESKKKDSNSASVATTAKTYSGNPYREPSRVIQSKLDYYYTLPKGTGARSAFLKANPDVVQYWDQQNGLANEERLAMGLDLLSTDSKNSYGGYGYGGYGSGGSSDPSLNPLKYALPLSAGGKFKSPMASKGKAVKVGIKRKDTTAKPKVSIKKSMV